MVHSPQSIITGEEVTDGHESNWHVVDFAAGVAVGAVAGAGIAYLTTPRSGDDLRQEGIDLVDSARMLVNVPASTAKQNCATSSACKSVAVTPSPRPRQCAFAESHPPTIPLT
ncbi:MAG: hypothetical protein R2855_14015 [Thermomicrobiales bacterium]